MPDHGRYEGWQWALVENDLAIDNMPMVREYRDSLDIRVKYQAAVIPREVVRAIAEAVANSPLVTVA